MGHPDEDDYSNIKRELNNDSFKLETQQPQQDSKEPNNRISHSREEEEQHHYHRNHHHQQQQHHRHHHHREPYYITSPPPQHSVYHHHKLPSPHASHRDIHYPAPFYGSETIHHIPPTPHALSHFTSFSTYHSQSIEFTIAEQR